MRRVLAVLLAALPFATAVSAQTADTVLFDGKVVTVDKDFSIPDAIAISDGRVLATGTSAAPRLAQRTKPRAGARRWRCTPEIPPI